jgi:signal transduction histidine kinase
MANTVGGMDITVDAPGAPPGRRPARRVPWSPRAWSQAIYLAGGIPAQIAAWLIPVLLIRWALSHPAGNGSVLRWLVTILLIAAMFLVIPLLTRVHRQRLRVTAGVEIPPQPRRDLLTARGLVTALRSQALWRQVCYHALAAPALAAAAAVALGLWLVGLLCALTYVYAWGLRHDSILYRGTYAPPSSHLPHIAHLQVGVFVTFVGIAGLCAAPWVTSAVQALDIRAARTLLGPSRAEELQHRVERLTETRAGVVDAADAERRRLERDLHDGTQQRLVSLAINLGMARAEPGSAEQAQQAIAEAHEATKAALAELRDLIRGLHPAVLEDRGLDAALSGVAARMPIPVRLTVDLPRRPAPVIEAVAYFVVSEGLANIAKHAQATEAAIFVQRSGDRLHVIVTDDGVGGADPDRGTGLAGLARRAASVDGTFEIDSPPGGPTLLTVDLPCNR